MFCIISLAEFLGGPGLRTWFTLARSTSGNFRAGDGCGMDVVGGCGRHFPGYMEMKGVDIGKHENTRKHSY